jgi:glutathionyl-hydroquinone reductase
MRTYSPFQEAMEILAWKDQCQAGDRQNGCRYSNLKCPWLHRALHYRSLGKLARLLTKNPQSGPSHQDPQDCEVDPDDAAA